MTVKVFKPRKSNFTRPIFSTQVISNCVIVSLLLPTYKGRCSTSGVSEITMPAACVDACRVNPSRDLAVLIKSAISGRSWPLEALVRF